MKKLLIIPFFLFAFHCAYNQSDSLIKWTINKIDSIARTNNITMAEVIFNKTYNEGTTEWSFKANFRFDGPFLVLKNEYYNIDKLLYFIVEKDHIEFYFQKI